jgi:hypothetical protein
MDIRKMVRAAVLTAVAGSALAVAAHAQNVDPSASGRGGVHVLKLTNEARDTIQAVYAAPAGTLDLSDDLLGRQTAGPGRTVTLKIDDPKGVCVFDLEVLMNNGDDITKKGVNVCTAESYTFTP